MQTLSIHISRARNLPRSFFRKPSPYVELHTLPGSPPTASTQPVQNDLNPEWDYTYRYKTSHHAPYALAFIVIDTDRRRSQIGRLLLDISHSITEGWYPLSEDASSSAEIFITVTCPAHCFRKAAVCPIIERKLPSFHIDENSDAELRQVASLPGFLFRSGEVLVTLRAIGVPTSVRKPHLRVSLRDQLLRADETRESSSEWEENLKEDDSLQEAQVTKSELDPGETRQSKSLDLAHDTDNGANHESHSASCELRSSSFLPHTKETIVEEMQGGIPRDTRNKNLVLAKRVGSVARKSAKIGAAAITSERRKRRPRATSIPENIDMVTERTRQDSDPLSSTGLNCKDQECGSKSSGLLDNSCEQERSTNVDNTHSSTADRETTVTPNPMSFLDQKRIDITSALQFPLGPKERRNVDFGTVKFATFVGEFTGTLTIQLADRASHLPLKLATLTEQKIDLKEFQNLKCSCDERCNAHILEYQIADTGARNRKIIFHVTIVVRKWKPRAASNDVTEHFRELLAGIEQMSPHLKETFPHAEHLTYLLVGGLFTDHYPTYFERNIKYLQETIQIPRVQAVPIHTEGSVERNSKIIRDSVLKTCRGPKSVVLIGHSKGGVDATAIISQYPETVPFLYGIISFQAPFGGTFLVDFVSKNKIAMTAIGGVMKGLLKGDQQAFHDIGYMSRLKSLGFTRTTSDDAPMKEVTGTDQSGMGDSASIPFDIIQHNAQLLQVYQRVPIVSFGSFASFDLTSIRTAANAAGIASMAPAAQKVVQHTGFLCDGLVTACDARIPFSDSVSLDDMMHTEPALYVKGTQYPPGKLTACALVLLFEKAERSKSPDESNSRG